MSEPGNVLMPIDSEAGEKPQPAQTEQGERPPRTFRTLSQLALGGALLALKTLSDGLEQIEAEPTQPPPEERDLKSVLIPAEEWETTLQHELESRPGQVLLGLAVDSQSRLSRAGGGILRRGNRVAVRMGRALDPLVSSRVFSPVRGPFESLVERGQAQINHWRELGRSEEAQSRAMAQTALDRVIDTSMDTVSHDPRVEVFVQQFIQEQSMGFIDEAIEEVRERTVTGDMLIERPVRSILRRRPREAVAPSPEVIKNLPRPSVRGRV